MFGLNQDIQLAEDCHSKEDFAVKNILLVLLFLFGLPFSASGMEKLDEAKVSRYLSRNFIHYGTNLVSEGRVELYYKLVRNQSILIVHSEFGLDGKLTWLAIIIPNNFPKDLLNAELRSISAFLFGKTGSGQIGLIYRDILKQKLPQNFYIQALKIQGQIFEEKVSRFIVMRFP